MSSVSAPAGGRRFTPKAFARGTHAAFLVGWKREKVYYGPTPDRPTLLDVFHSGASVFLAVIDCTGSLPQEQDSNHLRQLAAQWVLSRLPSLRSLSLPAEVRVRAKPGRG